MLDFMKKIIQGTEIIFDDNKNDNIKRKKSLNVKKEIRIAKTIRKTSMLQRSSNRVRNIVTSALS